MAVYRQLLLPNYEKDMDPMLEQILVFYEVGGPLYK